MEGRKLYRASAFFPFSALQLPWTQTDENGKEVPVRLEDPTPESDQMIGFLPIFGNEDAARKWSNGRFTVEEINLHSQTPVVQRRPAYATVSQPPVQQPPANPPVPDNTVAVNPNSHRGRRRGRK